jgi:hypothetical protein
MTEKNMTIGFFGDSFCANISNEHSITHNYNTYLEKVADHFSATITNTGVGGSSVWDLILIQFQEQLSKELPDVCIFVWTDAHRVFNRTYRNLNFKSVLRTNSKIHTAAKEYWHNLYDEEKHRLEYVALLHYIDTVILPKYPNTIFVHLWSFGEDPIDGNSETTYAHQWTTGTEIRPALETLAYPLVELDDRANHIAGDENNTLVSNWIINAINHQLALKPILCHLQS